PLEDGPRLVERLADELRGVAQRRQQRLARLEGRARQLELAPPLDEHLTGAVDHDVGHRRVVQERADRREELQQRLVVNLVRDHATRGTSEPRASAGGGPFGQSRRYSRKCLSAVSTSPASSRSRTASA